jgi:hypothetical protein
MDAGEVLQRLGPRATLSHESAAAVWDIPLVGTSVNRVTVPRDRRRAVVDGWEVRRRDLAPDEVVVVNGQRVTTPLRTLLDLALVLPLPEAVAAADAVLHDGAVEEVRLRHVLGSRRGRGARGPREVARLADGRAESVLESLARCAFAAAGLPAPELQREIRTADRDEFVARVDFCWPAAKLVVEVDGFTHHSDRLDFRRDRARTNALTQLGWRVLRFTWEDVRSSPAGMCAVIRTCLRAAA